MGYYIETPWNKNKAMQICEAVPGTIVLDLADTFQFSDIPEDKALICIVDNGPFEAAAYCYSPEELNEFRKEDGRPKKWLLMPRDKAEKLSGYKKR